MLNIGSILISLSFSIALLIAEELLCTKFKSPLWGGIIPMLFLLFTIYIFASERLPFERTNVSMFVLGLVLVFSKWESSRRKYKKIQQANLEKMRAKDI